MDAAPNVRAESVRLGMWSDEDVVGVRGRLRTRRGGVLDDTRTYRRHRVAGQPAKAGYDRRPASPAMIGRQREAA